jgi:hypothetical protein
VIYHCCHANRKAAILGQPGINGIDYLEVLDHDAIALGSPRQQTLLVHCLNPVPADLTPRNVLIEGGESVTGIAVDWLAPASAPPPLANPQEQAYFQGLADAPRVLVIRTSKPGDFSTYTLRLVDDTTAAVEDPFALTEVLSGFDPQSAAVSFSFKVECGPDFDCAPRPADCAPDLPSPPPINYLAKDYGSFRTVILDRLNQLLPNWKATSEADLGVMLAELIAYVGDHLSYQQDAVATEAYIETARSRISLRRHARLVDYTIHDGCNARAWVRLEVDSQAFLDHTRSRFYTYAPGMPPTLARGAGNEQAALVAGVKVFEPMQDAVLFPEHNRMFFYTWGDSDCCLPRGATEATLLGTYPDLQPGDVLIFQEMKGPQTGNPADADIRHRWAVRLTDVTIQDARGRTLVDPLYEAGTGRPIISPAVQQPTPVTEIRWSSDDALPFPFCLSSTVVGSDGKEQSVTDVSVAFGNVVLADHGLSFSDVAVGAVPAPALFYPPDPAADRCRPSPRSPLPARFRPTVLNSPLTQAVPLPLAGSPVTPGVVPLQLGGRVALTDANGFVCLMIQAVAPYDWPQWFGVTPRANAAHPANLDLAVVYNPPGGPAGVTGPVILENLTDLSFNPADPNFVALVVNRSSRFIEVPASYIPPAASPAAYPTTPTMLTAAGAVVLEDQAATPYLTIQATNPATWPPSFGVLAQGRSKDPSAFNLVVVYAPTSGSVGVALPVTVEKFLGLSLANVADAFASDSELIRVESFAQAPNPGLSAQALMSFDPAAAVPVIELKGTAPDGVATAWIPAPDLLEGSETSTAFVVEVESDGTASLRFGDDVNGRRPEAGTSFTAWYRIGNGTDGNVGADSLVSLATSDARIRSCTNPLPAVGGTDLETADQIRRRAPRAFLTQERAVTMGDYEAATDRLAQVQQSLASLRWTGSWYTVFIAAEPRGGGALNPSLRRTIDRYVDRYRLAGQDLEVVPPRYVPLELELEVCVDPAYFRGDVRRALAQVLSNHVLPDGARGLFHADNFTFGQTVYLSRIYAAARSVAGVRSVRATRFQPQGTETPYYLSIGEIPMSAAQIARLENDPSFPDHGRLTLVLEGGK